tara:strand:- start:183 stop:785 length:603 start_codon:yes stop_codon:yes gene_type:complete
MLFDDTYKEIEQEGRGLYKERGSKFIAYAYPVYSLNDIKIKLKHIKSIESSAHHHCYAYRLHPDKSMFKFSDDGEPAYTAGKPIFKQIEKYELTNILIVVVRYFGGIKLGIPGLIRAYKTATMNVITSISIHSKAIKEKYSIFFDPTHMNDVMQLIKKNKLEITNTGFDTECYITFLVEKRKSDLILEMLRKHHQIRIEY